MCLIERKMYTKRLLQRVYYNNSTIVVKNYFNVAQNFNKYHIFCLLHRIQQQTDKANKLIMFELDEVFAMWQQIYIHCTLCLNLNLNLKWALHCDKSARLEFEYESCVCGSVRRSENQQQKRGNQTMNFSFGHDKIRCETHFNSFNIILTWWMENWVEHIMEFGETRRRNCNIAIVLQVYIIKWV